MNKNKEASYLLSQYPDRIPIICHPKDYNKITYKHRVKYLVPDSLSFAQFQYVIRKNIQMKKEDALYFFVNNRIIPSSSMSISEIYSKYKNKDNFLYIVYSTENTFG